MHWRMPSQVFDFCVQRDNGPSLTHQQYVSAPSVVHARTRPKPPAEPPLGAPGDAR